MNNEKAYVNIWWGIGVLIILLVIVFLVQYHYCCRDFIKEKNKEKNIISKCDEINKLIENNEEYQTKLNELENNKFYIDHKELCNLNNKINSINNNNQ